MAKKMTKDQQAKHLQSQSARKTIIEERDAARAGTPKSRYPALDSSDDDAPFSSGGAAAVAGSHDDRVGAINSSTPMDLTEDASLREAEGGTRGEKFTVTGTQELTPTGTSGPSNSTDGQASGLSTPVNFALTDAMNHTDSSDDGGHRYVPANRTARKAAKAARQAQVQEQVQEQVSQEQAALQLRFDLLQAENAKLAKTLKIKKKALKRIRASRSGEGSPTGTNVQVVHASGSCDEDDEDVVSKHDFLEGSEPGTSEIIDAERATHAAAQAALQQQTQASLELASSVLAPTPVVHHLPPLPALPTPTNLLLIDQRGTRDRTSRMQCYGGNEELGREWENARLQERGELSDNDAVNPLPYSSAAGATAGEVIATGNHLIEKFIGAKAAEQMLKENEDLHDERVCRLISSGFQPREAFEALAATKVNGLESTARATEYLRVKSATPLANMAKAVGACQLQIGLLSTAAASAVASSAAKTEAVFGPSLS
jgi:hypothetical protein